MSLVLAYTSPAIGHLFPLTPLLLELQHRGHEIHLLTLADRVDHMRALGFAVEAIDPGIEQLELEDHKASNPRDALRYVGDVFSRRGRLDALDLRRAIDEREPDAVIVDVNSWGALFAAEQWGGRWMTFSPYTPALNVPGVPPFGPGLAPMTGPLGAARDAIARRLVAGVLRSTMLAPMNDLRASMGLGPVDSPDAFLRKSSLILVTTAKPFEYAATDWGQDVVMIGACAWEPPQQAPEWLDAITQPIVLVTTSSEFQDDGILVRTALQALAGEPVHVVATMPAGAPDTLDVPANATVVTFVPHSTVLRRAAVAITHGGMGATQKALSFGVPVCVVPFGRDQMEVARRVEVSRSGVRLPVKKLTPDRLRKAVTLAMTKGDGARRVAEGYAATGGPAAGADVIEQRLLSGADAARVNGARSMNRR